MKAETGPLLAFGAHPDDLEFGAGGVIARESQRGRRVHMVVCSRGESGSVGNPAQRTREATRAAKILGATLEFADLGGDAHFEIRLEHTLKLARIVRIVRPSIVLAPTTVENQHPDHYRLGAMVRDACRLARYGGVAELRDLPAHSIGSLFYYALGSEAEPHGVTPLLVDISSPKLIALWTRAMQAHSSQTSAREYVQLQLARARALGLRAGVQHAMALFPNDPLVVDSLADVPRAARRF